MSTILYGKDDTERIVAAHSHDDEHVMIYFRDENGNVRKYPTKCWAYHLTSAKGVSAAQEIQTPQWASHHHAVIPLTRSATSEYDHIITSRSHSDNKAIQKVLREKDLLVKSGGSIVSQYLTQTGRTFYKGMSLLNVRRMQIDIETISPSGGFPNADRKEDEIVIVSVSDNHGFECAIHTGPNYLEVPHCRAVKNEYELLIMLMRTILMRDPDIIEGHNIFNFDLPYIIKRAALHEVYFGIGRNNKPPSIRPSSKRFAERDLEYQHVTIDGRAVVDTMFMVIEHDVFKRDMPSHGLKAAAKYFDVARKGRVYVEGDAITRTWQDDPARLLEYALDDVRETRALSEKLLPSLFELTKMVPASLQDIHTGGVGGALSKLFTREYLRQRHAIPRPERGKQILGGMTGVGIRGVVHDLLYIDVSSLYPSIMLNYTVQPDSDVLGVFQSALADLTRLRLETKGKLKGYEEGSSVYVQIDAQQSAYKRIINSFYGALGYERFEWNDLSEADRVALTGQTILVRMMEVLTAHGCKIVEADTDGIICTRPADVTDPLAFVKQQIEPKMPKGIKLDLDGVPKTMMSYRPKNYAILTDKGKIKIKGGAFKSRGIELMFREWMQKAIKYILEGKFNDLRDATEDVKRRLVAREYAVNEISRRQILKKPLREYLAGKGPKQAQYELWSKNPSLFDVGDPVHYYIANTGRKEGYLTARLVSEHVPGTEWTEHYLKRFDEVTKKFECFFDHDDYKRIFRSKPNVGQLDAFGAPPKPDLSGLVLPTVEVTSFDTFKQTLTKNSAMYTAQY